MAEAWGVLLDFAEQAERLIRGEKCLTQNAEHVAAADPLGVSERASVA